ncbi:MAG TPA: hypothetical protein VNL77_10075 [Roseiflexaceae bacterium]|nr:hypothetical protein [Roseiflexaceae bacterium]
MQPSLADLQARRMYNWGQTPATRAADPEAATQLIDRLGIATLYPASPEVPNLYHAYVGDPAAKPESAWDSPAGHVYSWRWALGRREAAFYTAVVRGKPTWVSWELLPAILRLRAERRTPDDLYHAGAISEAAHRVARALEDVGGVLSTGDLRRIASFPTGKAERAAYLKAVAELDTRLMLAKVFAEGDEDMRHALVAVRYPQHVAAADRLTRAAALDQLLAHYLPGAAYAVPPALAKHLGLPEDELRAGLERLVAQRRAVQLSIPGQRAPGYAWVG